MLGRTVACRMSFEECEGFVDDVCRAKNKDSRELPMLVLGNKNDRPADKQVCYFDSLCVSCVQSDGCGRAGENRRLAIFWR